MWHSRVFEVFFWFAINFVIGKYRQPLTPSVNDWPPMRPIRPGVAWYADRPSVTFHYAWFHWLTFYQGNYTMRWIATLDGTVEPCVGLLLYYIRVRPVAYDCMCRWNDDCLLCHDHLWGYDLLNNSECQMPPQWHWHDCLHQSLINLRPRWFLCREPSRMQSSTG